ncbi:PrsW family intramembrane metalloprotease [Aestuariivivens insulae]|uniref:PrsW family intramembrane metalloprotease n=1 Tax=Aestuariivivens insulae TaxID=1621988 RepID=UPI001F561F46|nr:PrsW family glutamic-type intramembrane protease [Aestuariivivens insulae]
MYLLLAAIVPSLIIIFYIYRKDRYEREPKRLILLNFFLGAIVSIIITTILYYAFNIVLPLANRMSVFQQFVKAFFVVALTEEFSKYVIVRYVAQNNKSFNEPFDGIVYALTVSMGFAATENILYVFEGGYQIALIRAFTAVPAHATFGILMGYFMGKAKFSKHKTILNLLGLLAAMLFHGAYDFFLFIDFVPGIWSGALASLVIGIVLSRKAIRHHQNNSHFKPL